MVIGNSASFLIVLQIWWPQILGDDYVPPTTTLQSCLREIVVMKISGTTAGGLVYTRTTQGYNIQPTVDGDMEYTCSFEDCGIHWNVQFQIVVQRRSVIQTQDDIIVTFLCSHDLSEITPLEFASSDGTYENGTLVASYRPIVRMALYIDNEVLSGGSYVKLGTEIMMKIEITNDEDDMFDFDVKSCRASSIDLLLDKCSLDEELFPNFNKTSIATVYNTFHMFRPTTTHTGSISVIISCDLMFCEGWCPEIYCNKTAESVEKREVDFPLVVATMLRVGLEDIVEKAPARPRRDLCVHAGLLIGIGTGFCVFIISAWTGIYICYQKHNTAEKEKDKEAENKTNLNENSEGPRQVSTDKQNKRRSSSFNVNEITCKKGIKRMSSAEFSNQAFSTKVTTDKTGPIYVDVSDKTNGRNATENTKQPIEMAPNSNVPNISEVAKSLTIASFKQFSDSLEKKLDRSSQQPSRTQSVSSVLKNSITLKPILKPSARQKQRSEYTRDKPSFEESSCKGERESYIDPAQRGNNSTMTEQESKIFFAKFLSNINSFRRHSSITKTESRENLLEFSKDN